jgi:hypothetical protein
MILWQYLYLFWFFLQALCLSYCSVHTNAQTETKLKSHVNVYTTESTSDKLKKYKARLFTAVRISNKVKKAFSHLPGATYKIKTYLNTQAYL